MLSIRNSLVLLILSGFFFTGCSYNPQSSTMYQVSTINALLSGVYDATYTVKDLKEHGDFGLGTFNGINGEMVMLDGNVYQVESDGSVSLKSNEIGVPFATVHFFNSQNSKQLEMIDDYEVLKEKLDKFTECKNYPCAFKITGIFKHIKTRAAPKATKPYQRLAKYITATQNFFTKESVSGTLIGYKLPKYFANFNVPGYHFHFLSDDKTFGGHVLNVSIDEATAIVEVLYDFKVSLLRTKEFEESDLKSGADALNKVEK